MKWNKRKGIVGGKSIPVFHLLSALSATRGTLKRKPSNYFTFSFIPGLNFSLLHYSSAKQKLGATSSSEAKKSNSKTYRTLHFPVQPESESKISSLLFCCLLSLLIIFPLYQVYYCRYSTNGGKLLTVQTRKPTHKRLIVSATGLILYCFPEDRVRVIVITHHCQF